MTSELDVEVAILFVVVWFLPLLSHGFRFLSKFKIQKFKYVIRMRKYSGERCFKPGRGFGYFWCGEARKS